ncbi:S8 family serine peptidase [Ancylobacter oerskovii]|uniref:S8 family serine peptidase n=1 Tax=Ancylobacter oerskovii TaxID=459519 RepID=A0ABW4Z2F5_9HYPH|nr:S8 family serine peptidase [Ancylobacter oerskovii]MBS7544711.1 autotransporter domain-containing protein [Ancylobacter oerskovii]
MAEPRQPSRTEWTSLQAALGTAAGYGDRSLIASVVENARLTPYRSTAIETVAQQLRPELAGAIRQAAATGQELARLTAAASPSPAGGTGVLANPTPFPGGDPNIPPSSLSEYQRNYSLDAMHVDAALALGLTGRGVTVGVIDSGIDIRPDGTMHPEFAGRIDPRSTSFLYWFDPARLPANWDEEDFYAAFVQGPTDPMDLDGHGTHVAGIIGAGQNGFGMQGVASGATLLAVKAIAGGGTVPYNGGELSIVDIEYCGPSILKGGCDEIGGKDFAAETYAFQYLAQFPDVRVINGSFGPNPPRGAVNWDLGDAVQQGYLLAEAQMARRNLDAGQIIVMAAGNGRIYSPIRSESPDGIGLYPFIQPANQGVRNSAGYLVYDDHGSGLDLSFTSAEALAAAEAEDGNARGRIVVVVALDAYNQLASYSQMCGVAMNWCVSAPGGDQVAVRFPDRGLPGDRGIDSTVPKDSYDYYSGTSMASPNVAGALAVLIEAYPSFTPAEIVNIMFVTAQDLGAPGIDEIYGWGLVRLDRALAAGPVGMNGSGTYTVGAENTDIAWLVGFTGQGSLDKVGSGTLTVLDDVTFQKASTVDGGTLSVEGALTTPSLAIATNGTLGGTGRVNADVTIAGTLAPGHSPGTLTVSGDVTLASTATTRIEIDGPATGSGAGSFDRLVVLGAESVFTAGGTLAPVLRGIVGEATNSFTPSLGQSFAFVQAPSITGSFAALAQPDSGLPAGTRLDVLYAPQTLALAATPARYGDFAALGLSSTRNERSLGAAIDALRPAAGVRPDANANDLFNILYAADAMALDRGFSSLTGQLQADMATTAVRAVGRFADTLGERQMGVALNRLATTGTPYGTGEAWVAGETNATNVSGSLGLAGYDTRASNVVLGLDWRFGFGVAGIAASYEYADVSAGVDGSGDVDTYHGGLYGTFAIGPMALALRGGVTYGDLSTVRTTTLGAYSEAAASNGHGLGGFAEATLFRAFETPAVTVTPSATLGYRGFHRDGMGETGSLFALSVPGQTFDETQATLAVAFSRRVVLSNGTVLEPVLSAGWRHDFGDLAQTSDLDILGTIFETESAPIGSNAFLGRLELNAVASDRLSLGAAYEAEIRDNLTGHTFAAQATLRF